MQRLLEELPAKGSKAWPAPQGELRAHRSELRYVNVAPASAASVAAGSRQLLDLSLPGRYALPHWGGGFTVRSVARDGLPAEALARAELRWREGGERFSRGPGLPSRPLKHQYQAAGLAAHERYGPLVWSADQLLFVPGLGPNARQCEPGAGLALEWWASEAAEP